MQNAYVAFILSIFQNKIIKVDKLFLNIELQILKCDHNVYNEHVTELQCGKFQAYQINELLHK
jgi:hypothetical protein